MNTQHIGLDCSWLYPLVLLLPSNHKHKHKTDVGDVRDFSADAATSATPPHSLVSIFLHQIQTIQLQQLQQIQFLFNQFVIQNLFYLFFVYRHFYV